MGKFRCTAHIEYDFIIEADSADDADLEAHLTLADDVAKGRIPLDVFESPEGVPPLLVAVDVKEVAYERS